MLLLLVDDEPWLLLGRLKDHCSCFFLVLVKISLCNKIVLTELAAEIWESRDNARKTGDMRTKDELSNSQTGFK